MGEKNSIFDPFKPILDYFKRKSKKFLKNFNIFSKISQKLE